jgi:hypothetical protein
MKQLVYPLLIAGTALLTACSNFSSGTITAREKLALGLIQPKETMLDEARAYKKLRIRVDQKTKEFSRIIEAYKTKVSLAGREDHVTRISLSKTIRDQSLAFHRESHLIQPFCTVMGPCPTYNKERERLDASIRCFDSLAKRLWPEKGRIGKL